jgi:hypothetical protein
MYMCHRLVPFREFGVLTLHKWSTLFYATIWGVFSYALGKELSQQAHTLVAFLFNRTTPSIAGSQGDQD